MHLYDRALLNAAALRAVGYDKNAPDFPAGEVQRDRHGNPTGLLIANPNANILYSTLAKGPKLSRQDQLNLFPSLLPRTQPLRHHQRDSTPEADFRTIPTTMA